jgi:hypothetical protein
VKKRTSIADLFTLSTKKAPKGVSGYILVQDGESLQAALNAHPEPYDTIAQAGADMERVEKADKVNTVSSNSKSKR